MRMQLQRSCSVQPKPEDKTAPIGGADGLEGSVMRKPIYLIALAVPVALLASCGDDEEPSTDTGSEAPVSSVDELRTAVEGQSVIIGSSSFPNASITGAFKTVENLEEMFGVDVDFRLLDSDPLVAATISGQVDVGQLSLAGMVNANAAGADFVAFGADDQKNTFVVAAKAPIESLDEVRGEPFAVTQNLNQITGQTAQVCLQEEGMSLDDVQVLRLGNTGEATAAIASGQAAAGISATFRLTQLQLDEGEDAYNILCRGWEANPQISSIWYAERSWVEDNPNLALAINIASLESARWAQEDKQAWVDFAVENVEGLTPEAAEVDYDTLVDELDNWPVNGSMDQELMQNTLDISLEYEAIPEEVNLDDVSTFEFQDQALEILGEE